MLNVHTYGCLGEYFGEKGTHFYIENKMLSYWWNFHQRLHQKLSFDTFEYSLSWKCQKWHISFILNGPNWFWHRVIRKDQDVKTHPSKTKGPFHEYGLTHWGRDKMAAIFQTTFSNAFTWMEMHEFRFRFHWNLFPRFQSTKFQHWFG